MGGIAGSCGAFIGTPAEVALIRMTSDGRLPPGFDSFFFRFLFFTNIFIVVTLI